MPSVRSLEPDGLELVLHLLRHSLHYLFSGDAVSWERETRKPERRANQWCYWYNDNIKFNYQTHNSVRHRHVWSATNRVLLTGELLYGLYHLAQKRVVLLLHSGRCVSLDVLEDKRTQRCVRHQREVQQKVRDGPPKARRALLGLILYAYGSLCFHWHLRPRSACSPWGERL